MGIAFIGIVYAFFHSQVKRLQVVSSIDFVDTRAKLQFGNRMFTAGWQLIQLQRNSAGTNPRILDINRLNYRTDTTKL